MIKRQVISSKRAILGLLIVLSAGLFLVSLTLGRYPIPVGCTGFAAEQIWNAVMGERDKFFPMTGIRNPLKMLGDPSKSDDRIVNAIFSILDKVIGHAV